MYVESMFITVGYLDPCNVLSDLRILRRRSPKIVVCFEP